MRIEKHVTRGLLRLYKGDIAGCSLLLLKAHFFLPVSHCILISSYIVIKRRLNEDLWLTNMKSQASHCGIYVKTYQCVCAASCCSRKEEVQCGKSNK